MSSTVDFNATICQKVRFMVPSLKSKNDGEVKIYFQDMLLQFFKKSASLLPAAKVENEAVNEEEIICKNTAISFKYVKGKPVINASTKIKKRINNEEEVQQNEEEQVQKKIPPKFIKDVADVSKDELFIFEAFNKHQEYNMEHFENQKKEHCEFLEVICNYFIKLCIERNANYRFVFITTCYFNKFKKCNVSSYQATFYECENSDLKNYCKFVNEHILRIPGLSPEFYEINKGFMDEIKSIRESIPAISDEASICSEMSELTVEKTFENDVRCITPHGIEDILRCSTPNSYVEKLKAGLSSTPKMKIAPGLPNKVENEIASALPTDENSFSLKMMKKVKPLSTMLQIIAQPTSVPKNDQSVSVSVPDKKYSLECDGKEVVYDNGSFVFKDNLLMNTISSLCQNYGVEKLSDVQKDIILQFHKSFRSDDAIVEGSDEIFSKLKVKNQENGKFYEDCFKKRDQYFFLTETGNAVYFDKCGLI